MIAKASAPLALNLYLVIAEKQIPVPGSEPLPGTISQGTTTVLALKAPSMPKIRNRKLPLLLSVQTQGLRHSLCM